MSSKLRTGMKYYAYGKRSAPQLGKYSKRSKADHSAHFLAVLDPITFIFIFFTIIITKIILLKLLN